MEDDIEPIVSYWQTALAGDTQYVAVLADEVRRWARDLRAAGLPTADVAAALDRLLGRMRDSVAYKYRDVFDSEATRGERRDALETDVVSWFREGFYG